MKKNNMKRAFTLAEVLITLAIIGVVAAITIPSLNNNINKQDTVAKVKKAYSVLSQATEAIKAECGGKIQNCITNPDADDNDNVTRQEVADLYKAKLQLNKECPTATDEGCFGNVVYKYLNNTANFNYATASWMKNARFSLVDGTSVVFDWNGETYSPGVLYHIDIDINGIKSPNQWGKDLFAFYYDSKSNTIRPLGIASNCKQTSAGTDCAAKVLQDSEINYY